MKKSDAKIFTGQSEPNAKSAPLERSDLNIYDPF